MSPGGPKTRDALIRLAEPTTLDALASRFGGELRGGALQVLRLLCAVDRPRREALVPVTSVRYARMARDAVGSGASLLVDRSVAGRTELSGLPAWVHERATLVLAELLMDAVVEEDGSRGEGCMIAPSAVVGPRVHIGRRVRIGPGAVVGSPGFGFVEGRDGQLVHVPQLGGVVLEDEVWIGANATIDAGTLGPTFVGRGVKIDAQVHVGHNCRIGEGSILCAQTGLAGSVIVGRACLLGGQVGVADHVTIGDHARVAAKSGVIGDVPPRGVVAGYPAVARGRWLRGLAHLYQRVARHPEEPE